MHACVQCNVWRPLRLPGVLVGDSALGGISTTLAAHDCLRHRGYDVPAVVLTDNSLQNWKYLRERLGSGALVLSLPECPPAPERWAILLHRMTGISTRHMLRLHSICLIILPLGQEAPATNI